MLNLERLRILHAISTYGSVSAAADVLHVTTSAVSQQMGKLERETGQTLLAKNGRGVRLTDAGRLLSGHAGRILSLVELAHSDLEAHRGAAVGELRMGAFPTAVRGLFPQALAATRRDHPKLRAMVHEMEPQDALARLVRGDIDLAVVLDWYNKPLSLPGGLAKEPLLDDIADVVVPEGHPCPAAPRSTSANSPTTTGSPGRTAASATSGCCSPCAARAWNRVSPTTPRSIPRCWPSSPPAWASPSSRAWAAAPSRSGSEPSACGTP